MLPVVGVDADRGLSQRAMDDVLGGELGEAPITNAERLPWTDTQSGGNAAERR
jgi:hypothetical protein